MAWDDDDGAGFGSAFLPEDGIILEPGQYYQLVITGFGNADSGSFTLDLGGDAVFFLLICPTLGEWGLIAFIGLLGNAGAAWSRQTKKLA